MALPDLIEIVPLDSPVRAELTVPGSKSITNRALALAALAEGETLLHGALWSEDTQVMVECLQELGFMVNVAPDPDEPGNRNLTVYGKDGAMPAGGTPERPIELFVGNAGTAARFLTTLVCLGQGVYRLEGTPRMHERPQGALFQALRELGYRLDSPNDKLPVVIHGGGRRSGQCRVSIEQSSQFASALLLGSAAADWRITVSGENAEESPYVVMTTKLMEVFPRSGGAFQIEPDASSGSYFLGVPTFEIAGRHPAVTVRNWPTSGWQVDANFPRFAALGVTAPASGSGEPVSISRNRDLGDSIMLLITLAALGAQPVRFTDLGRLRLQECERVVALRTELTRCGARVVEQGDTLTVYPSALHGAEIATYEDHRMAMCFGILGLKVPGITLHNPACVKKTFPNFFQKLAAPPPAGLGAVIRESRTGRKLALTELLAA